MKCQISTSESKQKLVFSPLRTDSVKRRLRLKGNEVSKRNVVKYPTTSIYLTNSKLNTNLIHTMNKSCKKEAAGLSLPLQMVST